MTYQEYVSFGTTLNDKEGQYQDEDGVGGEHHIQVVDRSKATQMMEIRKGVSDLKRKIDTKIASDADGLVWPLRSWG